jgi:hypothetical protein
MASMDICRSVSLRVDARPLLAAVVELKELCRGRTRADIEARMGGVLDRDGLALDLLIDAVNDWRRGKVAMLPSAEFKRILRRLRQARAA